MFVGFFTHHSLKVMLQFFIGHEVNFDDHRPNKYIKDRQSKRERHIIAWQALYLKQLSCPKVGGLNNQSECKIVFNPPGQFPPYPFKQPTEQKIPNEASEYAPCVERMMDILFEDHEVPYDREDPHHPEKNEWRAAEKVLKELHALPCPTIVDRTRNRFRYFQTYRQ